LPLSKNNEITILNENVSEFDNQKSNSLSVFSFQVPMFQEWCKNTHVNFYYACNYVLSNGKSFSYSVLSVTEFSEAQSRVEFYSTIVEEIFLEEKFIIEIKQFNYSERLKLTPLGMFFHFKLSKIKFS